MTTSPALKLQRLRTLVRNLYPNLKVVESVNNPVKLPSQDGEIPMQARTLVDPDTGETVTVYVCQVCQYLFFTDKEN